MKHITKRITLALSSLIITQRTLTTPNELKAKKQMAQETAIKILIKHSEILHQQVKSTPLEYESTHNFLMKMLRIKNQIIESKKKQDFPSTSL